MDYPCTIKRLTNGDWLATALGSEVGNVQATARTREQALEKLRNEIRYRIEFCPCSSVADDYVHLVVKEQPPSGWKGKVW